MIKVLEVNRGEHPKDDENTVIYSPLDGYVESVSSYSVSGLGQSKFVSIIQYMPQGKYRFYVAHLNQQLVTEGQYVQAGKTPIGVLGKTGATSPHAHCNLRLNGKTVPFYFDAE